MVFLLRLIRKNLFHIVYLVLFLFAVWQVGRFNIYQQSYFFNTSNAFAAKVSGTKQAVKDYFNLKQANEALIAENSKLNNLLAGISTDSMQRIRFKDSNFSGQYEYIPARVIHATTDLQNNFIAIDKGSKDGMMKDMAVVAPDGVVGVVLDVSGSYSLILPVLNTKFKATPMIPAIGFKDGSITWDGKNPKRIQLNGVSRFEKVQAGMMVLTSNYSVKFPPGIPIGTVYTVKNTGKSSFYEIDIEPAVDFARISNVYAIKNNRRVELDTLIRRNNGN